MALEFHVITSHEFFRLGAHGELDWPRSLEVLRTLANEFKARSTHLALLDLRDTRAELSDTHLKTLAAMLEGLGLTDRHRIAILIPAIPNPRPPIFVSAARRRGFDVDRFDSYEKAAEWLSRAEGEDPDFDREIYLGPGDQKAPDVQPPGGPG